MTSKHLTTTYTTTKESTNYSVLTSKEFILD